MSRAAPPFLVRASARPLASSRCRRWPAAISPRAHGAKSRPRGIGLPGGLVSWGAIAGSHQSLPSPAPLLPVAPGGRAVRSPRPARHLIHSPLCGQALALPLSLNARQQPPRDVSDAMHACCLPSSSAALPGDCLTSSRAGHSSEGGFQDVGQVIQELGQVVQGEGCHG